MEKATTLKEIAYELGLSVNTISRALRDCDDISASTKKKVIDTAIRLGYMRSSLNQLTTKDGKKLIVVITGGVANLYYNIYLNELRKGILESGHNMAVIFCNSLVVDEDMIKQCISERADGVISLCNMNEEAYRLLKLQNLPICFLGSYKLIGESFVNGICDCVDLDENSRCGLIVSYLLSAHKECEYAFFGPDNNIEVEKQIETISTELKKNGHSMTFYSKEMCESFFDFLLKKKKVAIVAFSDEYAYSLLDYLNSRAPSFRRMFPGFHIVSTDALSLKIKGLVDITSVYASYEDSVSHALELLFSRMKDHSLKPRTVSMPCQLHIRANY